MCKLWNGIAQHYNDQLWRHMAEIFKRLQNRVCIFSFRVGLLFLSTFRRSNRTPKKYANFDAASGKRAKFDEVQFSIKHTPKLIIFGTHNLQTFKHNTLIKKLLLMQFFLFNIHPKLHRRKWRKLLIALLRTFSTSPAACWCCYSSNLYQEICYKIPSDVTFTFMQTFDQNFVFFAEWCHVDRQCEA